MLVFCFSDNNSSFKLKRSSQNMQGLAYLLVNPLGIVIIFIFEHPECNNQKEKKSLTFLSPEV